MTALKWTEQELELLRELRGTKSLSKLAEQFDRPRWAVKEQAQKLGLQKKREAFKSWSPTELESLRVLYPTHTARQIAAILNRPWESVRKQAQKLKITDPKVGKQPIGTETLRRKGLLRKVSDTGPKHERWRQAHVVDWEALHGPIPDGHYLVRINKALPPSVANSRLVTVAQLGKEQSHEHLPPEVRELISLRNKLVRKLKDLEAQA